MQDVELHMDPAIAERNPSGIALMHQLTEPIHRPHLIGIDGRSGAGKTSLAGQLAQVLSVTRDVVVFHLEDLYPGWDGLDRGIAMYEESILSRCATAGTPTGRRGTGWPTRRADRG